jgi:NAD(P)H-hydrate epimerase
MADERFVVGLEREAWRFGAEVVWLPTADEMSALDRYAVEIGATTERTLIEVAGREVARRVQHHFPTGPVTAVAGRGHNGADALVAVRTLAVWGREVRVVLAGDAPPEPDVLTGAGITPAPASDLPRLSAGAAVIVDGILGTGVTGPPREPQAALIRSINELGVPVLSVDGPSGADFSTGAVTGACIRADVTVSLGWPNFGLLRQPAREHCGLIEAVEIGFPPPPGPMRARAITGRWVAATLMPRAPDAHKGRAGYLVLVAGREGMAGAAVLSARSALRGGVGILKVVGDEANREILQKAVPGAIFVGWSDADAVREAVEWAGAVAVGPGLGRCDSTRELVTRVLDARGGRPVVLDADGLSSFTDHTDVLAERLGDRDVITPHPGELARLTRSSVDAIVADPVAAAMEAAARFGCVVLLKGAPSLVAETDQPLRVSTTGGPAVAAGGTGDVLTGLIAAYLAVGMRPADAAAAALFITGAAAARSVEPVGHLASDIPASIPGVRADVALPDPPTGPLIFASSL